MQELLVVFACLNSTGCSETSNAYYQAHPEFQEMLRVNERRLKNFVGPTIVESSAPFLFVAAGGTGNFKLYGDFSLQIHQYKNTLLLFNKGF